MGEIWHSEVTTVNPTSGERFCSVEFLYEEGNIDAVPLSWTKSRRIGKVNGKQAVMGKCYWPPKSMARRVHALAKKQVQPDRLTWDLFDVALLKYGSTFAECTASLKELSGIEEDCNNSSDDDLAKTRRDKSKLRKRRLSRSDESETEDESIFNASQLLSNQPEGSSSGDGSPNQQSGIESGSLRKSPEKSGGLTSPKKSKGGKSPSKSQGDCTTAPRKESREKSPVKGISKSPVKGISKSPSKGIFKSPSKSIWESPSVPSRECTGKGARTPLKLSAPVRTPQKEQSKGRAKTPVKTGKEAVDKPRTPGKALGFKSPTADNGISFPNRAISLSPSKQPRLKDVTLPQPEFTFSQNEQAMTSREHPFTFSQKRHLPTKQSRMSDYVESISESELADIQEDIDRLRQVTSPASTVGSARILTMFEAQKLKCWCSIVILGKFCVR
ncbi:neurofilament heavy polypeptide-like [Thrips palmi]|uniref:Neurofilament heavy polypeptide-like n=1 Tax=Thrips palmi TaxID=161013 RepID=A0A6P8ZZK7_THRPL|nr:neurofilament heavy polypeptide-like [Thrips palmi]